MHYHNRARAHLKEQTGITFRDHEGKRGRGDATRSYPPKRISRKVRNVVHHIQRFPSFYRDSCDSRTPRSFFAVETRRINDEAAFVYLTQFVALFRAAARWIKIFSNISRNIQWSRHLIRTNFYRGKGRFFLTEFCSRNPARVSALIDTAHSIFINTSNTGDFWRPCAKSGCLKTSWISRDIRDEYAIK